MTARRFVESRRLIQSLAAVAVLAASPVSAELGRGTSVDDWKGYGGVAAGGKGYVTAPMGQLHYRDIGPRTTKHPIMLFHQSPMSLVQWAEVQNALAELGYRTITLDTPGYGNSDQPAKQPTIGDYADNAVALLDALKIDKVIVGGHHTGAQIATAFAARHGDRVVGIMVHGAAALTPEEADVYLSNPNRRSRMPKGDGSHLQAFKPQTPPDSQEILNAKQWNMLLSYVQGPDIGHYAAFHYDMFPDLKAIKVPGMVLSDTKDPINKQDKRVAALRPDWKYVEFSNGDLLQFMAEPKRWAKIAADFAAPLQK